MHTCSDSFPTKRRKYQHQDSFRHRMPFAAVTWSLLVIHAAAGGCGAVAATELSVASDFVGGSGECLSIERRGDTTDIEITPTLQLQRGWPCWWYIRIDGAAPGQTIRLTVRGNGRPFRGTQKIAASWATPQRAALSFDGHRWGQTEVATLTPDAATYRIVAEQASFWVAWGPPFLSSHADALLEEINQTLCRDHDPVKRFVLERTRENRPVHAIRFGNPAATDAIWVQARQHAWESGSSWVGDGFVRWVASEDPLAIRMRQSTEIFFIPIMDVDNVDRGAGGKDAAPRDHNRDWADRPVYPEVQAAQREIQHQIDLGRLRVFVDLHNPAPNDLEPFFFGPLDYDQLSPLARRNYDRFLASALQFIRGPLAIHPRYRFATYVPTAEEQSRVSRNWVGDRIGEHGVSVTLETAWNTPASSIEGYRGVGRGLAMAIANHLIPSDNNSVDVNTENPDAPDPDAAAPNPPVPNRPDSGDP